MKVYEPNAQPTKYICDIDSTVAHIQEMFQKLSKNDFGKYVKNISCFKYKKAPSAFYIKATSMQSKKRSKFHSKTGHVHTNLTKKILNWNWIRDKRSSQPNSDAYGDFINAKDFGNDYFDDFDDESKGFEVENLKGNLQYALRDEKEDYDKLYLDGDGVYRRRENERKKRGAVDMTDVVNGLRNLPPLRPLIDEIFVIRGDSTTIQCNASGFPLYSYSNLSNFDQYTWSAERKAMLQYSNTKLFGPTISIVNIQPRNFGTYTCYKDKSVIRSVKLNVIVIPDFNVVFTPLYKCQSECTYEDLMNIQKLGPMMSKAMCSGDDEPDSIRIDEPVCMSNKENENVLKPTVVMKSSPQPTIECSPECQRDLKCSLALLWASNAPSLAFVKVVIFYDDFNKTLTPLDTCDSDLTTVMALKKKDSNGHHEYRRLVLDMEPGNVDVVVTCPAGFYLLADQKICAVCPADTCSLAGENTCTACPRGTHAPPGSCACRLAFGPHRPNVLLLPPHAKCVDRVEATLRGDVQQWQWQWQVCAWQWCVVVCGVVCGGCVALALSTRRLRGQCEPPATLSVPGCLSAAQTQGRVRRPLSPSRVLLERIFKRSPSSSRATDSQETRFGMWKERNGPPPLPPIDFDL
ncbi:unnamed protein product [Parnassius mnemosyne]|uniref:Ig-like domain-containing protein n=1 Tax=Parnassius mnemosyne TaxID=213953 RepID=A0AAV1LHP6_9NEOP